MTDYRHAPDSFNQSNPYRSRETSGTSIGGIVIALALIAAIFLGLSFLFGGTVDPSTSNTAAEPNALEKTTEQPAPTPVPITPQPAPAD